MNVSATAESMEKGSGDAIGEMEGYTLSCTGVTITAVVDLWGIEESDMVTKRPIALSVFLYLAVSAFLAYKRITKPQSPARRGR